MTLNIGAEGSSPNRAEREMVLKQYYLGCLRTPPTWSPTRWEGGRP